jgi:SAM-dependent methyltransferase
MDNKLKEIYHRDRDVWNECAEVYEEQIVGGHPDIAAFEAFEEDFLEEILRYLADEQERPIKLMDIGCGSGRLHSHFGAKTIQASSLPESSPIRHIKECRPSLTFDDLLADRLCEVWGIDFSQSMIDLARRKHHEAGFDDCTPVEFTFEQGSAFELEPEDMDVLPVAVCLVNSIGVMQGVEGAVELVQIHAACCGRCWRDSYHLCLPAGICSFLCTRTVRIDPRRLRSAQMDAS